MRGGSVVHDMGVNLRGGKGSMPQKKGDIFDLHAVLEQVRGYGVAQDVQGEAFLPYRLVRAGALQVFQPENQRLGRVYKQPLVLQLVQAAEVVDIVFQRLVNAVAQGYHAVFVVFSLPHKEGFAVEVYVLEGEPQSFGFPQPAAVVEGENQPQLLLPALPLEAGQLGARVGDVRDKGFYLLLGERLCAKGVFHFAPLNPEAGRGQRLGKAALMQELQELVHRVKLLVQVRVAQPALPPLVLAALQVVEIFPYMAVFELGDMQELFLLQPFKKKADSVSADVH